MTTPSPLNPEAAAGIDLKRRCPFKVRLALDILLASPSVRVNLDDLAARVHYDKYHLSRLFVRHFNAPPARLHRALRLAHAARLIREGRPSSSVAAELGFADQSHLTRLFRRAYRVTPSVYARAHRSQPHSGGLP